MVQGLSALAALLGVAISAAISLVLSKWVAANEIKKMRLETKKAFDSKLIEERLKRYPELFALLSQFIKDVEFGSVSKETVKTLLTAVNAWDSQNAIVLSHSTAKGCYDYRHYLSNLLKNEENSFSEDRLKELHTMTAVVEFALRSDIGIYGIKSSKEGDIEIRHVDSYARLEEITQELKEMKRDLKESSRHDPSRESPDNAALAKGPWWSWARWR